MTAPEIIFWQVTDNKQKLKRICQLVEEHFAKAQRVLVAVPNEQAAAYVDQLLWASPADSFVPHVVSQKQIAAAVVITTAGQNINDAQVLINLCPTISPAASEFQYIHELLDITDKEKERLSRERQAAYQRSGLTTRLENS